MHTSENPHDDLIRAHDDVTQAFRSGTVWDASDEDLKRYLRGIAGHPIHNPGLIAPEIVRGLALNHIQMARVIERLSKQNESLSRRVYWLTIVATLAGIAQVVAIFLKA